MSTPSTTWRRALAWRQRRQLLAPLGPVDAAGVVEQLGAVLAMDAQLADLAVIARSTTARPGDVARAVADGTVVQVFAFRGAMHLLSPTDAGTYLALRSAGRQWELPSWVEHYRLAPEDWPPFRAAVREALADGPLTLAELGEAVTAHRAYRHLRPVFDDGAGTLIKPLTWQGDLSFGPPRDGSRTFWRLDLNSRWTGIPPLEEAGPRAVRAYLRSYGPATPDHVHHWLGQGLSAGRRRLDRWWDGLTDELAAVDVDGRSAYVLGEDLDGLLASEPTEAVHLLPGHDQWVMGPGTKDEQVTPAALRDLMTRKASPVVADGVVSGTWSHSGDTLAVRWLAGRTPPRRALEEATARLARATGQALSLTVEDAG